MERNPNDPVVDEIREIRQRISARFDHDPAQLVAYYMRLQQRHRDRLSAPPTDEEHDAEIIAATREMGRNGPD